MKRSWVSNLVIAVVIGLLTLFLALQYNWLSEAAEAERERMQKRVEMDTKNFADEFNREIQAAYFNFQTDSLTWTNADYTEFNERYDYWKTRTAYPELIRDIVFLPQDPTAASLKYNADKRSFEPLQLSDKLSAIRSRLAAAKGTTTILEDDYTLAIPIYDNERRLERIFLKQVPNGGTPVVKMPDTYGHVAVLLDKSTINDRILPELAEKHFPERHYKVGVYDKAKHPVYQTGTITNEPDASAQLFTLSPDNLIFFANRNVLSSPNGEKRTGVIVNQRIESHTFSRTQSGDGESSGTFKIELQNDEPGKPRKSIIAGTNTSDDPWRLDVQHASGSIDAYIRGERNKSFALGLSIYLLLVGSILAIVLSALRSKRFAQRQIDFVSSVSHEFRTPLAVIYSAGENLADGVTKDREQILRYGQLIKGEGKKLSGMVEQILEFAGARSGRKKYSFTEINIADVLKNALAECSPMIEEKGFEVETNIAPDLPTLNADHEALSTAIQNLLQNAVKYSNGNRWLRLSAENGNARVKISVEDRGIGISGDDLRQIFEPFFRTKDVVDAQIHGNGLGLSLVKEIIEAHGGMVDVSSEAGKGSKFTIELPR
ncbi:MAG: sensor histidine kinase [Blastocatellia bacterium]